MDILISRRARIDEQLAQLSMEQPHDARSVCQALGFLLEPVDDYEFYRRIRSRAYLYFQSEPEAFVLQYAPSHVESEWFSFDVIREVGRFHLETGVMGCRWKGQALYHTDDYLRRRREHQLSQQEWEVERRLNRFAVNFLINESVLKTMSEAEPLTVEAIRDRFRVPYKLAQLRLQSFTTASQMSLF